MDIIQQFREERIKQGLRQTDVSERAGMTQKYYQGVETRRYHPNYNTLVRLADALGCVVTLQPKAADSEEDGR